jgi:hypothetical protein
MNKILLAVSVLALSACGSSNDTTTGENAVAGEENPSEAATAAVQPSAEAVPSEAPAAPAAAASETWKCNGGGGSYTLVFTDMKEQTNPRGGSETYGKYRIKGTNSFDVPASGDLSIRGGLYYLNDSVDFQPAQDGSDSIAHFTESGDVNECTKG